MREYKCLSKQTYSFNEYKIVPIRDEDRYDIMQWRNEQIYHLRQSKHLDKESQDRYFNTVIANLFEKDSPDQILFSYLHGNECVGYGGLVHINWIDKNAEISFIMKTKLEENEFDLHWINFLTMINLVAVTELNLIKSFTYAFDLRPKLYTVLDYCGYKLEARLKKHKYIGDSFVDILIHSKINE